MINFIDVKYFNQKYKEEILKKFNDILDSGEYILGKNLEQFEKDFAQYNGVKYCVGVNSGTDALKMSLLCLGIKPGDEVLTVSFTFPATIMAILSIGAIPVYVDIDEDGLMDSKDLFNKITPKSKAVIPVHFAGNVCKMANILRIARLHHLKIIEDACQAVGSTYLNQKAGSFGDCGCFSFFPTKNLSCMGDGGAIITNDSVLAYELQLYRNFGRTDREVFLTLGENSRLDEMQAAILSVKLKHFEEILSHRIQKADYYTENLPSNYQLIKNKSSSSYHLYMVKGQWKKKLNNLYFVGYMKENGVDCRIHYALPCHMQHFYKTNCHLPKTDELTSSIFTLPLSDSLTQKEQEYILNLMRNFEGNI